MKKLTEWKESKRRVMDNMKRVWKSFWAEEDGMGSVEIILILVILVGIVCVFRKQVTKIIENAFKQIKSDSTDANKKVSISGGY